ncbi:MAG TPA: glycosyltransferase family 39 protein [Patescibacteria group bacterium]|nr:glycosyltransferase family 39 protein [Patescibacteria group bacterium]
MWKLIIIVIASFLRIWQLGQLTEFLGDQGRTMLVLRDFIERGIIPVAGPTTLSGHHLGPMFYYLLAPGYILFGGGPIGVSLWMVVLGIVAVLVLYEVVTLMFGVWPARAVSLLWAVSPFIIRSDRVIWEPNLVPLFALLFVYLLYKVHGAWTWGKWLALGAVTGILIQLHYPTVFFIGLLVLYAGSLLVLRLRNIGDVAFAFAWGFIGFTVSLLPFLWYESTVGFQDIIGVISVMASGGGDPVGKRVMVSLWLEYAFRIFGRTLPYMSRVTVMVPIFLWLFFFVRRPTKRNVFLTAWFFGGLLPMGRFSWAVYDHYLFFLIPVPFLMIASVLSTIKQHTQQYVAVCILGVVVIFQLMKVDVFKPGNNDIQRVATAVSMIRDEIGDSRFSFTLINSKSFSDLHYRYFMDNMGLKPESITDAYPTLVLICDQADCPAPLSLVKDTEVQVICYEERCLGVYPKIALFSDWNYETSKVVGDGLGRIYMFKRRPDLVQ